jgi:hypothetical protein
MTTEKLGRLALEELHRVRPAVGYPVTPKTLTDPERELVKDSEAGGPRANGGTSSREQTINVDVIRDLLLGEVFDDGTAKRYTTHSHGVDLRKATIVNKLGEPAVLDLSECRDLRPLSLTECRLGGIVARNSTIDGALFLRDCEIGRGVDLYGLRCNAIGIVGGCVGVLEENASRPHARADSGPISIDAEDCDVRGDITLEDVKLRSTVSLMDARARYLLIRGVTTEPSESDLVSVHNSVVADRMTVHGSVNIIRCKFKVKSTDPGGAIRFASATIGSQFVIRATSAGRNMEGASAVLQNMKVGGNLLVDGEEPGAPEKAEMYLSGDIALADTSASRIVISNMTALSLDAYGVAANVEMRIGPGATILDRIEASGCHVGRFSLLSSHIGKTLDRREEPSLLLRNATILGDLRIGEGAEIRRMTDLHHVHISGDVLIAGYRPIGYGPSSASPCDGQNSSRPGTGGQTVLRAGRQGCALAADFASVRGALRIDQTKVDGSITLESADLGQVCISQSEVGANRGYAINANRSKVRGPVVLGPRLIAFGPVRVEDAAAGFVDVCAEIYSRGAQSDKSECTCEKAGRTADVAFSLARTSVASDVRFSGDVTMDGAFSVFASRIGGSLELDNAKIAGCNDEGNSLLASRVHIENNLTLDDGFRSDGGVAIRGGRVGGQALIRGDKIGANTLGFSIFASFLNTGRGISIRGHGSKGLDLDGAVDLRNASTKDLVIRHIQAYADKSGTAIMCDGVIVVRSISLDMVSAYGKISFARCEAADFSFTGSVSMAGRATCTGVDLSRSSVAHHVVLDNLNCQGHVNMREATFGNLAMKHAHISGTPECHHISLGKAAIFGLDAMGVDVKNNLDISYLRSEDNVCVADATVGRTFVMKDLSEVDGRLWLNGTSADTVIFFDGDGLVDQRERVPEPTRS